MLNSNNILCEIKSLVQQLIAKQEAIELEQKKHLDVIFKIAREQLNTPNTDHVESEKNLVLAVRDLVITTKNLPQIIVEQIKGIVTYSMVHTMNETHSDIVKLIDKVIVQLQDILQELKFDPDNPKPIELRTEENSKQILQLSEQVVPLVVKCQQLLEQLDPLISQISKALS